MVAKILQSTSTFNAVNYNSNKLNKGSGELMAVENMGALSFDKNPKQEVVKNYLKAFSNTNKRVKNPQFHAMISAKGKEYNKYQLTEVAKMYMDKMGYGKQPYIIVFHNDTDNNHIHIVSTRVDINGKKINDSFERIRSQKSMQEIMFAKYNVSESLNLNKLLSYKYSDVGELKTLLKANSFELALKEDGYHFFKGKVLIDKKDNLSFNTITNSEKNTLKSKLITYSRTYNSTLSFENGKWRSEAVDKLKHSLGIDIVFHHKGEKQPFGYSIIDNNNLTVSKGSDILKLKEFLNPVLFVEQIDETVHVVYDEKAEIKYHQLTEPDYDIPDFPIDESNYTNDFTSNNSDKQKDYNFASDISKLMVDIDRQEQEEQDNELDNKYNRFRKRKR